MQRRTFLAGVALGSGAVAVGCNSDTATQNRALARLATGEGTDLDRLADTILATDASALSDTALGWLDSGLTERDILSAAYLAGLREIDPSPIGGQVHALMMVASASAAMAVLPKSKRPLPMLFHLQRTKRSVGRDARGGDWTMPKAPAFEAAPRGEHIAAFRRAMEQWDEPAGDRAAVALHGELSLREFFEELWPWAARDFRIIGHKMIFAPQTFRAIEDLGWRLGRDAVRAVVRGILDQNPFGRFADSESKAILRNFAHNRGKLDRFPVDWRVRAGDSSTSLALMHRLRDADPDGAADAVLAAFAKGAGERDAWDGVRLAAFEIMLRHPDIAGMHPVTSVNALWRGSVITDTEDTRRLCLLQAASWMVMFRDFLVARGPRELRIDEIAAPGRKGAVRDPFAELNEVNARREAMGYAVDPAQFTRRAIEVLATKAQHDHDYKVTIAAVEEIAAAAPRWRPHLAAASMAVLRRDDAADHRVVEPWRRWQKGG